MSESELRYCCDYWDEVLDRDEYFFEKDDGIWWGAYSWGEPRKVLVCPWCGAKDCLKN